MVLFPSIYWMGFFIGSIGYGVNGIGPSISVGAASSSEIEDTSSLFRPVIKRAERALLVPYENYESSEEHHKSKRCWRAHPAQGEIRLSTLYPEDTAYDFDKLNEHEKRSVEESEGEYSGRTESLDEEIEKNHPHLRILRVKNPRANLKEFLRVDQELQDETLNQQSGEDSEDVILKRIKNHLNSDQYNVLALVGKRARHPRPSLNKKYICYCRRADCSGENCQRMTYRPCSTCKNSRPVFFGKASNNYCSHGGGNSHKTDESQSTDARVPLTIQYPNAAGENPSAGYPANTDVQSMKNPKISLSANTANNLGYGNSQQHLPAGEGSGYQFSYDTPRVRIEGPINNFKLSDQFGILRAPISTKSAMDSGISGPGISAIGYRPSMGKPARNEYGNENIKFTPDRTAYNQWAVNSYYPMTGIAGDREIRNRNGGTDRKNSVNTYQSRDESTSRKIPFVNGGIVGYPHPGSPGSHLSRTNFRATEPKIMTHFIPIQNNENYGGNYGFGWNIPRHGVTRTHPPQQQDTETPSKTLSYQKKPAPPLIQSPRLYGGAENRKVVENIDGKISSTESESESYYTSTENNFHVVTVNSDELYDDNSEDSGYEQDDITTEESIFLDGEKSIGRNVARTAEDVRNFHYTGVSDEPQKYKIPLIAVEKVDSSAKHDESSGGIRDYETSGSEDLDLEIDWTGSSTQEAKSDESVSSATDYNIIGSKTPDQDNQEDNLDEYNSFEAQLERPANGKSDRGELYDDSTTEVAFGGESNGDFVGQVSTGEETESGKLTGNDYPGIQVITNGYFTSKTYDDFEETPNEDDSVEEINLQYDHDENVSMTIVEPSTADCSDGGISECSNHEQYGREDLPGRLSSPRNQLLDVGSRHVKFDDGIERSWKNSEAPSVELIGEQGKGSANYGSATYKAEDNYETDSWRGMKTQNRNEGGAGGARNNFSPVSAPHEHNFKEYSQSESIESYGDDSSSVNVFTDYSGEDRSPEVFNDPNFESFVPNSEGTEDNRDLGKHVAIADSATKYFSPNDIVLKYIKKHGQNSAAPFYSAVTDGDMRFVTPIYHTNLEGNQSAEPDYEASDSRFASYETITQPSDDGSDSYEHERGDSDEQAAFPDHEIPRDFDETVIEAPQYVGREYLTSSNCRESIPEIKTIDFKELDNVNFVGESSKIASGGNMRGAEDHEVYESDYRYSSEVDKDDSHNMSEEVDDHTEEFYDCEGSELGDNYKLASSEHEKKSAEDDVRVDSDEKKVIVDTSISSGTGEPLKVTERHGNVAEESTHGNGFGKILHHINPDVETTEYQTVEVSTEGNDYYHTKGENYNARQSAGENIAKYTTQGVWSDHYDSVESTDDFMLLGDSEEQIVGLNNEKSEITRTKDGYSHHKYDYVDSTESSTSSKESFESSTDHSVADLSVSEYNAQYNKRGNEAFVGKSISSCSDSVAERKSSPAEDNDNDKFLAGKFLGSSSEESGEANEDEEETIPKDFQNHFSSLYEKVDTFEAHTAQPLDYGRLSIPKDQSSEVNGLKKSTLNREIVGTENYAIELSNENSKPGKVAEENTSASPQIVESDEDDYLNPRRAYEEDVERRDIIELQTISSSEEQSTEEIARDESYDYNIQRQDYGGTHFSTTSTEAHDHESLSQVQSGKSSERGYERREDSGEITSVEIVSSPHSTECCTKPPEVQDDIGYLGRLKPKESNVDIKSLGDLVDSDLYYIGDGVKLPLTIKKLKDGSLALSLSDKICEHRLKKKCPCCVPREGRILQEKHIEENDEESSGKTESSSLHRRAIPDDEKSEIDDSGVNKKSGPKDADKKQDHSKRTARSISMPVDEFAEKYNLLLDLNEQPLGDRGDFKAAETDSLIKNVIGRDEGTKDDAHSNGDNIVEKLLLITDQIPENDKEDVLLSTLENLIGRKPSEVLGLVNDEMRKNLRVIEFSEVGDDQEDNKFPDDEARYGYQRDNPILDRINIIKQLQDEASRCEHKYQKDCHEAITEKTKLLTMILQWLKELIMS